MESRSHRTPATKAAVRTKADLIALVLRVAVADWPLRLAVHDAKAFVENAFRWLTG